MRCLVAFVFLLVFSFGCSKAQKQASVWYQGSSTGIDFNKGYPTNYTRLNPAVSGYFAAAISDDDGNLVCYSSGDSIWTKTKALADSRVSLSETIFQPSFAHIIPAPGRLHEYYLFFEFGRFSNIRYNMFEVNPDGSGQMLQKLQTLYSPTGGGHSVVFHANGKEVWLMAHGLENDEFMAFLITDTGVKPPIISKIGRRLGLQSKVFLRDIKFSPNGKKLAIIVADESESGNTKAYVDLFEFHNETGLLSNAKTLMFENFQPISAPLGQLLEFSPNSNVLYTPANDPIESKQYLLQFDLKVPNGRLAIAERIQNSGIKSLQIANNGKIYFLPYQSNTLGVINNPNSFGIKAGVEYISNSTNFSSFPRFNQSYFFLPKGNFDMPNVFTPNGDLYNPSFAPIKANYVETGFLKIVNRWGQVVFATDDVFAGWDGGDSPQGVYYWSIEFEGANGEKGTQKGWVHLVR
ncbi:MAG: gliding motility-associated C-terminal domain-containing protein [Bacteroidota bacterium]|jgi:gliding motility-associated-like protein|nr:gliding motility-associated C-terminal domain-containing protein [Cytophagales bacterium]MCE2958679.1 gliding motility-associated C-terminal domain-containing protein [Flammeovirgaceae bacterium]